MTETLWSGGLTSEHDLMFAARPDDPEMRESTSFWLFEKDGAFALPRFGIEAEAADWDNRRVQFNAAFPGGRVLNGAGMGAAHSPLDAQGQPTILGAGPLRTRCIEPFRKWELSWSGDALDGTHKQQLATKLAGANRTPVEFKAVLEMAAPAWVHDFAPEKVAAMTIEERREAEYMGIGYRIEQLFRGAGELTIDGTTRAFECQGSRIHRQSVRPLGGFRGHCWQSAVFPDGRAFAYIAYPPHDDGSEAFNDGYVYVEGRWHKARAKSPPWLRRIQYEGDDVAVEMVCAAGTFRIAGRTLLSTFRVGNPDIGGLDLQQGSAWYEWDGQRAIGMIERSSHESLTEIAGG
jgi:hypothetical protein